ncbi:hypothetical protein HPB49_011636 [Dermacentor silvarum]|uniref:Uncharacterized protein n=1 Tax=Dermacentor silvarum TaxID=543639 RepID=A0ACB8CR71_DERSI|nr:hypothetical protein HPB49_011636 [Dermacentor silvarum]
MSLGITVAEASCHTPLEIGQVNAAVECSLPVADKSVGCSFKAGSESSSSQTTQTVHPSSSTSAMLLWVQLEVWQQNRDVLHELQQLRHEVRVVSERLDETEPLDKTRAVSQPALSTVPPVLPRLPADNIKDLEAVVRDDAIAATLRSKRIAGHPGPFPASKDCQHARHGTNAFPPAKCPGHHATAAPKVLGHQRRRLAELENMEARIRPLRHGYLPQSTAKRGTSCYFSYGHRRGRAQDLQHFCLQ